MTTNGSLFHRVDGLIAQEDGQEKVVEISTLAPGLAPNCHLELLRGVLQNDGEYNKLEDDISKIGEFLSQNNRYAQLLYTAKETVQQETTEIGLTRAKTVVEFTHIELTAPTNLQHRTSLLPEVKEVTSVRRSITPEQTSISVQIKESYTGGFTFIKTMSRSVFDL
ncbi:uncharacterized protein CYBJADRAFT_73366 [Cyberlindnera jadinii NRRL Y-1542]|uniref:Uncharacterized protein n=1 Tax=Cyberlindnera jadinii (strain ATCC 18201 / CBS 1600 / BCRC 20928 / JCM 3617 / NBRC 0987 / NRRL Y-1542) TaxID=983966 RepID=A0A1E4S4H4_CYBJN|nr:hypothetical protein CYBJADRAFT_73366 [Cyberlindnera jadinii NRRL Y-1542]ODV74426.1 hypothetical protein CYBJADRAFT_73366 [Cyberlindnera jadinii NRRL Y-1542]